LGRKEAFKILEVSSTGARVCPAASGTERWIPRPQIEEAHSELVSIGSIDLAGIRRYSEMNPVYVAAILATLDGICFKNKPKIVLTYIRDKNA
jgi:hypothetical protein